MSRPRDWSPLACIDPVPGDHDRVEWLGKHYRQVAWAISDTARKLRQIADHQDMQSEAVEAFRNIAREVANYTTRAHERYDGVGRALIGYAPELRDVQSESAAALAQAKDAEADLAAANRLARAAEARIDGAPEGADTTADRGAHRRAVAAAEDANDALAAARRRLSRATDARDAAARRADLNNGWWDNWGAKVGHGILDVAGLVPIIGEPADGINALWYGAEGDWTNAGLSAAGMIPIGGWFATGGKLVGKGVDAARGADEAAQAGAKALALPQKANGA